MVLEIKRLLYERGYTIERARRELSNGSKAPVEQKHLFETTLSLAELKSIRRELESVLTLLSRKC